MRGLPNYGSLLKIKETEDYFRMKLYKFLAAFLLAMAIFASPSAAAASKVYTISPGSKPYKGLMTHFSTYNTYTKHYYLLRSYLEQLEHIGGGTLIIEKGTYTISNTLYVPSNVTIRFKDGVKIIKGTKTGTKMFGPSKTVFQLIKPSDSFKKGVRSKYNGEKNISFIGEGKAIIDLRYITDAIAIVAGHNRQLKIENIQFENLKQGHFIEMDATDTALISNNRFINSQPSENRNKEAINLDTPDKLTNGWHNPWSTYDKTPNKNITITNNTFTNLDRAIGTHKYSEGKYHDKIIIRGNYIEKMRQDAIRVMNWTNPVIEKNTIKDVADGGGTFRGILASGVKNPMFCYNTFEDIARPIGIMPWKNNGPGSEYKVTYNTINQQNIEALKTNHIINTTENFVRIYLQYNVFDRDRLIIPLP